MRVADRIAEKLTAGLSPLHLNVIDESHHHIGHAGHAAGGESHFRVEVVSASFDGKSRVDRHRMVNALLSEELAGPVHALAVSAKSPAEA